MKVDVYLGIDTSCYTTSVAAVDKNGRIVDEARKLLMVKPGKKGLAQSEMVFQHTRNLPVLIEELFGRNDMKIIGIGVSKKPRPVENSYMPAFLSGYGLARSLAKVCCVPLVAITHQENHLEAALHSSGIGELQRGLFLHASGGTTEILVIEKQPCLKYQLTEIGGSIDLHAGQFIDRVGVALGLSFPAGPHVEALAAKAETAYVLPVAAQGTSLSFSGPCSAALRAIENGVPNANLALGVQIALAESFARVIVATVHVKKLKNIVFAGGVMSNLFIREYLKKALQKEDITLWFAGPTFSADNALGCAVAAQRLLGEGKDE